MNANYAITNVRAVLADRVVDDATIVVRNGVIDDVGVIAAPPDALDGRGMFAVPGLIDTHSDGLEKEIWPRPGVAMPMDFALRSFEGRVRAAGVTTVFHGVAFQEGESGSRSVAQAHTMCEEINARSVDPDALLDHRTLFRLDVRDARGLGALVAELRSANDDVPLVSYEDHTPGIGQYRDRTFFERQVAGTADLTETEAQAYIDEVLVRRTALLENRQPALDWLSDRAHAGLLRLMCHDPADGADIDDATDQDVSIAEFPTTVEAARRARERGMVTVAGAPNVVRGGSHSGNVSASELIGLGLVDGLASDYLPSSLLGAVGRLVQTGVCDMASAVRLVTSGAAKVAGISDRGELRPGARGDVVVVGFAGSLPTVHAVVRAADRFVPTASAGAADSSRLATLAR